MNMTIPWDLNVKSWSSCRMLDVELTPEYFDEGIPVNESVKCGHWVFDTSTYKSSTVMEVCSNIILSNFNTNIYSKFCYLQI